MTINKQTKNIEIALSNTPIGLSVLISRVSSWASGLEDKSEIKLNCY